MPENRCFSESVLKYKRRAFQEERISGLMNRAPTPRSFLDETPAEIREKIIKLSIDHPAWRQVRYQTSSGLKAYR